MSMTQELKDVLKMWLSLVFLIPCVVFAALYIGIVFLFRLIFRRKERKEESEYEKKSESTIIYYA